MELSSDLSTKLSNLKLSNIQPTILQNPIFQSVLLVIIPLLGIVMNSVSFNSLVFKCDNYLLNVYLYYLLLIGLFITSILTIQNYNIQPSELYQGYSNYLILFISLVMFFILTFIPSNYFITKNLFLFITVIVSSLPLYGLVDEYKNDLIPISKTLIMLFIGLAGFSYFFPTIEETTSPILLAGLGFILSLSHQYYQEYSNEITITNQNKLISSGLGAFIFYSIPSLALNANNCVNPDYINQILAYLRPFSSQ